MVWECISSKEVGRLKFITGNVNASVYADILEECLKETVRDNFRVTNKCIFQQYSTPCHMVNLVNKF